jgi:hypothetical protein
MMYMRKVRKHQALGKQTLRLRTNSEHASPSCLRKQFVFDDIFYCSDTRFPDVVMSLAAPGGVNLSLPASLSRIKYEEETPIRGGWNQQFLPTGASFRSPLLRFNFNLMIQLQF